MKSFYGNVVLITGASSGIGRATAELLAKNGFRVYGTTRKPVAENPVTENGASSEAGQDPCESGKDTGDTGKDANGGFIKMVQLDVCDDQSVKKAVDYIMEREGTIDILINNAGFGIAGAIEDTSIEEAGRQFDTNFFGVLRMCRALLPIMREKKRGLIINVSSVAGQLSIPYQSMYSASKYALEALTEALRIEVRPFGIRATMVEPGDTKTDFTRNRQYTAAAASDSSVYRERFEKAINTMIKDEMNGPTPEVVARVILKLIGKANPPIRVTVGFQYKAILFLKRLLPSRFVEYVLSRLY